MTVYRLPEEPVFPPVSHAEEDGLLAVGGDLTAPRLLEAYRSGIFPWYSDSSPILWWAPDPRFVITPDSFRMGRTLRKEVRALDFHWTFNTQFEGVMKACAVQERPGQDGTWITEEMLEAYVHLHEMGYAHSVEVWDGKEMVGGLYGVSISGAFFGESMFSRRTDASKIALAYLVDRLRQAGFQLFDTQFLTEHLASLGAVEIPRGSYHERLDEAIALHADFGGPPVPTAQDVIQRNTQTS